MSFEEQLKIGAIGEGLIAGWLRSRGHHVMPVYEKEIASGKGPRLFSPDRQLIAPDMLTFKATDIRWIEAKHKTAFSWHRNTKRWVTGIDRRHYLDYLQVGSTTPFPVWLLFLHRGGQAKDSPADSPAGLFGNRLAFLCTHVNHTHDHWGTSGMVYWAIDSLRRLATLDEVLLANRQSSPVAA